MTVLHRPFLLQREGDRDLHGRWHTPVSDVQGTVLFLHGYKGYMDWGAWALVGDHFAARGWRFLRLNFSHNGTSPLSPSDFTDLEAFAANTYSRELEEAIDVLRALRTPGSTEESRQAATAPLTIIGHSRGGGIACLAAAEADREFREQGLPGVDSLVTWAAVADFGSRFPVGEELDTWKATGRREIINHRTRQRLHHNWSFHEDFTTTPDGSTSNPPFATTQTGCWSPTAGTMPPSRWTMPRGCLNGAANPICSYWNRADTPSEHRNLGPKLSYQRP